jgi:excisionase family DNA binding protein
LYPGIAKSRLLIRLAVIVTPHKAGRSNHGEWLDLKPVRASARISVGFYMRSETSKAAKRAIEPVLLPIQAAAEYLGLSVASLYRLIGLGRLQAVKAGGKTLLPVASLQAYVASLPLAKIKPPTNRMGVAPRNKGRKQCL